MLRLSVAIIAACIAVGACTRASFCGDGVVDRDRGELCDAGSANGTAAGACRADCTPVTCGDGIVDPGEECDAGSANGTAPGACRPDCRSARCGDGIVDPGEECDAGAVTPSCPDGQLWCEVCGPACAPIPGATQGAVLGQLDTSLAGTGMATKQLSDAVPSRLAVATTDAGINTGYVGGGPAYGGYFIGDWWADDGTSTEKYESFFGGSQALFGGVAAVQDGEGGVWLVGSGSNLLASWDFTLAYQVNPNHSIVQCHFPDGRARDASWADGHLLVLAQQPAVPGTGWDPAAASTTVLMDASLPGCTVSTLSLDKGKTRLRATGDGRLVVVDGVDLWRLGADGHVDTTFGASGAVTFASEPQLIERLTDGAWVVVRYESGRLVVERVGIDGESVATLFEDAMYSADYHLPCVTAWRDGGVVLGVPDPLDFVVLVLQPDGRIVGQAKVDFGGSVDVLHAMSVDAKGRLVAAGIRMEGSSATALEIARLVF